MKCINIKLFIFFLISINLNFAGIDQDSIYFKNFVKNSNGNYCNTTPPNAQLTAFLNNDESRILTENAPRVDISALANIEGNGTFGVELANFINPSLQVGDLVSVRFTDGTNNEQGVLSSTVTGIPWLAFPQFLTLSQVSLPLKPEDVVLTRDSLSNSRTLSWTVTSGGSYSIYRRIIEDISFNGQQRNLYTRIAENLTSGSFTDVNTNPGETYAYIIYNISNAGVYSLHSSEVSEEIVVAPEHDLTISYIARIPRIDYVWNSQNPAVEGWPAVGQQVQWKAVVKNWFPENKDSVKYYWLEDNAIVDSGFVNISAGDTAWVYLDWTWTFDRNEIEFLLDPQNKIKEGEEENNSLLIYSDAISVGLYVEQSMYDYFYNYQRNLKAHSNCWEDWAQRHVKIWNEMLADAVYPESPDGVIDRVRLDKITVVPDGALPLAGGSYPTNMPNLADRTVDLQWGFPSTLLGGSFYSNHTAVSMTNPFYFEGSLFHELGHARYLIDGYGFNVHDDGSGTTVAITLSGQNIVGTPYMPLSGDVVHSNLYKGLMGGDYTIVDRYSAAAYNLIAGHRAILGNYNSPGNIGVYINDLPAQNIFQLKDKSGNLLANAQVHIYQAKGKSGIWYGKYYDDEPDLAFSTDGDGKVNLGRCPFDVDGTVEHDYGKANGVIILKIIKGDWVGFGFVEVTQFNLQYWSGNTAIANYELEVNMINVTDVEDDTQPTGYRLEQNYPNPFNPETKIKFSIPNRSNVKLSLYNLIGEEIKVLVDKELNGGVYEVEVRINEQDTHLSSGIYFYTLRASEFQQTRKMVLLK